MSKPVFWCCVAAFLAYFVGWGLELVEDMFVHIVEAPIVYDDQGFVVAEQED